MTTFGAAPSDTDDEEDPPRFEELGYAATCTEQLHEALLAAGYAGELVTDPAQLSAAALGERVDHHTRGGGVAVVHVLSHGDYHDAGGVFVVGSDGERDRKTRVEDWRIQVASDPKAPTTLFLLDLCHAGAANRHWTPPKPQQDERAWVIAAAGADQPAYAGRLTRAATKVIEEIAAGRDLDESLRWVKFGMLFERIQTQMQLLALEEGGYAQDPVCTPVMGEQPELHFFANPNYRPSRAGHAMTEVEPAIARFVDSVLDEDRFRDRASGHGPALRGGGFTGRVPQLDRLVRWLDGDTTPSAPDKSGGDGGLVVVTGSPGAGKSALLGILVCAAHPQLRESTWELWRAAQVRPSENPDLAAVHARQRDLTEIIDSLSRQLLLDSAEVAGTGPVRDLGDDAERPAVPRILIDAIVQRASAPVIVLDALDEALGAGQILEQLLVPLARARRDDGSPACRLLVGTRPEAEFTALFDLAHQTGEVLDLDTIPAEQQRADLTDYVAGLLELLPGYTGTTHRHGRRAFAEAVATTLVPDPPPPSPGLASSSSAGGQEPARWGEFLVAALYTHTLTLTDPHQLTDPDTAARLGAAAPRTLPEVLELDLRTRPKSTWRRPLLAVLARARGTGIPRYLAAAAVGAVAGTPAPSLDEVSEELAALSFYLRTTAETNGDALYRLFHQGLADYLSTDERATLGHNTVEVGILDGLLSTVPTKTESRRWDLADSYLLRHLAQHALDANRLDELLADPGFLIHAEPHAITAVLDHASSDQARLAAAIYTTSAHRHVTSTTEQRRDVLAIDAARYGAAALCRRLSQVPPESSWRPLWSTGGQVNVALDLTILAPSGPLLAVACTVLDGRPIAVTSSVDATVRVWDLTTGAQIGDPLTGHTSGVTGVACTVLNGRPVAVTSSRDATVRVWDLTTGAQIGDPLTGHTDEVAGVACTVLYGRPIAVTSSFDATVRVWDLTTGAQIGNPLTGHTDEVTGVACTVLYGRPIAVTSSRDATVWGWDLTTGAPIGDLMTGHTDTVTGVACTVLDGRPIAVTSSFDATVRVWDLTTGAQIGDPLTGHTHGVHAVACTVLDGRPIAVTSSGDDTVRVWDLTTGAPVGKPLTGNIFSVGAVTCTVLDGRPTAVTVNDDTVRVWDLSTRAPIGKPLTGHTDDVTGVACTVLDGRPVTVTSSVDATVRVWDLATGTPIGDPLTGHTEPVYRVACTVLNGRPVAITISGPRDATVRVWDLTTGAPIGDPLAGHTGGVTAVACTVLNGRPIAVTSGAPHDDATVRVWDLTTGALVSQPMIGHTGFVTAVACTVLDGRPVAVTSSDDATVQVWDLTAHAPIGKPLTGHTKMVYEVACTVLDGRPVAVTSSGDGTVRVWDLTTGAQIGAPLTGHTDEVTGVVCTVLDGRPVAVTSSFDDTVRVWDLIERRQIGRVDLPDYAGALAVTTEGLVVVAFGWEIVVLELATEQRQ